MGKVVGCVYLLSISGATCKYTNSLLEMCSCESIHISDTLYVRDSSSPYTRACELSVHAPIGVHLLVQRGVLMESTERCSGICESADEYLMVEG